MFVGIGYITIPLAIILYRRINASRDVAGDDGEKGKYTVQELRDLGDGAPDFRYTLWKVSSERM